MKRRRLLTNLSAASVATLLPWSASAQDEAQSPRLARVWVTFERRHEYGFRFAVRAIANRATQMRSGAFTVQSGTIRFGDGRAFALEGPVGGEPDRERSDRPRTRVGPRPIALSIGVGEEVVIGHITVPVGRSVEGLRRPRSAEFTMSFDGFRYSASLH